MANMMLYVKSVRNPRWASAAKKHIALDIEWTHLSERPFVADPNDPEPHGKLLFDLAVAGEYGPIAEWQAPPPVVEVEGPPAVNAP